MQTRAVIFPRLGQAELTTTEIAQPGPGEILVHNAGCGVCQMENKQFLGLLGDPFPVLRLGHEGIGHVEALGPEVTGFSVGDLVTTLWHPGFQEFNNVRADWAYVLPAHYTGQERYWFSEPAACALNGIYAAQIAAGDRVLLLGAGYMGLLLTQLAGHSLAREVVVADLDAAKLALAAQMGATRVIAAGTEDVATVAQAIGGFDIVIEATGAANMIERAAGFVRQGGRLIVFADHRHHTETVAWQVFGNSCLSVIFSDPMYNRDFPANWRTAIALMLAGRIDQTRLVTHAIPAERCQELMEIATLRKDGYIKGYLSWG